MLSEVFVIFIISDMSDFSLVWVVKIKSHLDGAESVGWGAVVLGILSVSAWGVGAPVVG